MKPVILAAAAATLLACAQADVPTASTPPTTGGTTGGTTPTSPATAVGPNVVVILGEAQGWTSTSVQMDPAVPASRQAQLKTPGLERIAAEGMRFSNFYAPSPRCTPSRAAFFTGRSPAALRMTFVGIGNDDAAMSGPLVTPTASTDLPTTYPTVASLLRNAGYATAHFGKWHVGRTNPSAYGFDASDGPTSNTGMNNVPNPNPAESYGVTSRAIAFMAEQVRAKKRFYLQVSHYPGKAPIDVKPETWAAAKAQMVGQNDNVVGIAASTLEMDNTIRLLQAALDSLGLAKNTYVMFWSDHGQQSTTYNAPLQNGKGTVWEGGVRIPFMISGPRIPAGSTSRVQASATDLMPTILDLLGVPLSPTIAGIEGGSLKAVVEGGGTGAVTRTRSDFVVHFPHYDFDPIGPASTYLAGNYKLIRSYEDGALRLYDLAADLGERNDLSRTMPARVTELNQKLTSYLTAVDAQLPTRK
jgi:arylsulfatase A